MCRHISCPTCHKPTWAGCGAHVEQVLGHVPPADRCPGHVRADAPHAESRTRSAGLIQSLLQRMGSRRR